MPDCRKKNGVSRTRRKVGGDNDSTAAAAAKNSNAVVFANNNSNAARKQQQQNAPSVAKNSNANAAKQQLAKRPEKDSDEVRDCKTRVRLKASHVDCQNEDCPLKKNCGVYEGIPLVGSSEWPLDGSMHWDQIKANYMGSDDPKKKAAFRKGLECIRRTLYEEYPDYKECSTTPKEVSARYKDPPSAGLRVAAGPKKTAAAAATNAKNNAKNNSNSGEAPANKGLLSLFSLGKSSGSKKKAPA